MMAELLLGVPLFPGESGVDQLVEIIKVRLLCMLGSLLHLLGLGLRRGCRSREVVLLGSAGSMGQHTAWGVSA